MKKPFVPPYHPACEAFPLMSDEDFAEFVEGMKSHHDDVVVHLHDGQIVDGRHRQRACIELGIQPTYETIELADDDTIEDWVWRKNANRRQLTALQKAQAARKLWPKTTEKDPTKENSVAKVAERIGVSANTVRNADKLMRESDRPSDTVEAKPQATPRQNWECERDEGRRLLCRFDELVRDIEEHASNPGLRPLFHQSWFSDAVASVRQNLNRSIPVCVCPVCGGMGCPVCKGTGRLNAEMKKAYEQSLEDAE